MPSVVKGWGLEAKNVKKHFDIVRVVSEYVAIDNTGGNTYRALCPFHGETSGSFYVYPDTQTYKCFGCGEYGDVIKFIMQMEDLSFAAALEYLWERKEDWGESDGTVVVHSARRGRVSLHVVTTVLQRLERLAPNRPRPMRVSQLDLTDPEEIFSQFYSPVQVVEGIARLWADSLFERVHEGRLEYGDYLSEEAELQRFMSRRISA